MSDKEQPKQKPSPKTAQSINVAARSGDLHRTSGGSGVLEHTGHGIYLTGKGGTTTCHGGVEYVCP